MHWFKHCSRCPQIGLPVRTLKAVYASVTSVTICVQLDMTAPGSLLLASPVE